MAKILEVATVHEQVVKETTENNQTMQVGVETEHVLSEITVKRDRGLSRADLEALATEALKL
ncbi:hypothetical protein LTR28_006304, partial [Elasticomyces elasticus]